MATAVKLSDQLIELAKPYAVPEQIEFRARLGKTAKENPELPILFIKNSLLAIAEAEASQLTKYSN